MPFARWLVPAPVDLPIGLWGMHADQQGRLRFAGRDILALVAEHGTPVHLLDVARLDANLAAFLEPAGQKAQRAEVYYSFKTQPLPWIIKRLLASGAGAEVISEHELELALHLGAPPHKIVYNGPGKSEASLRKAVQAGIQMLNINHIEEIERVAAAARAVGRKAQVGIRVVTASGWSSQFGCSIASGEAMAAFAHALATPELEVIGLHSHRGVHMHQPSALTAFVGEVLAFADALREKLAFEPRVLNFGGSLGIATVRPLTPLDHRLTRTLQTPVANPLPNGHLTPATYVRKLVETVEEHYRRLALPTPRLLIEPGRALTGNAQALAVRVVTTRTSPDGLDYAVLDGGTNIASILGSELHQLFRVNDFGAAADRHYRLVGPICHPGDVMFPCVRLPRLAAGDTLLVMDSGAYFEPDSTSFSFQRPATIALDANGAHVIRRAESLADMIHRDSY